jgi:hypothetical protein
MMPRSVKSCGCPQYSSCVHGTSDMDDLQEYEEAKYEVNINNK